MTAPTSELLKTFLAKCGPQLSACEACGNDFTCGATLTGCWCARLELSEATRAEVRSRYSGCLCYECALGNSQLKPPSQFPA